MAEQAPKFDPKIAVSKATKAAMLSLNTLAGVFMVAYIAIPPEALAMFVSGLNVQGWLGLAALPVLLAIQRYFENKVKIESKIQSATEEKS